MDRWLPKTRRGFFVVRVEDIIHEAFAMESRTMGEAGKMLGNRAPEFIEEFRSRTLAGLEMASRAAKNARCLQCSSDVRGYSIQATGRAPSSQWAGTIGAGDVLGT